MIRAPSPPGRNSCGSLARLSAWTLSRLGSLSCRCERGLAINRTASSRTKDALFLSHKPLRLQATGEDILSKKDRVSYFPSWNLSAGVPSSGNLKRRLALFCCTCPRLPELCRQTRTRCNCQHSRHEKALKLLAEGVFPKPALHHGCTWATFVYR